MLNVSVAGQNHSIIKPKIWKETIKFYLNLTFLKNGIKPIKTHKKKSPIKASWVGFFSTLTVITKNTRQTIQRTYSMR